MATLRKVTCSVRFHFRLVPEAFNREPMHRKGKPYHLFSHIFRLEFAHIISITYAGLIDPCVIGIVLVYFDLIFVVKSVSFVLFVLTLQTISLNGMIDLLL